MATEVQSTGAILVPYRLTVRQFEKMIDAGIFPEGVHVELLGGVLTAMTTHPPHIIIVTRLANLLRPLLPAGWFLLEEKPVRFGRFWRPEPDLAVVRGPDTNYLGRLARPEEIGLLVEVADSSYPKDAGIKLRRYATARIPVYWIVNVGKRQVEIYTDPQGRGRSALYRGIVIRKEGEQVPVVIDGQERGLLPVADLLP
jgi:Uma2 family endonuclease